MLRLVCILVAVAVAVIVDAGSAVADDAGGARVRQRAAEFAKTLGKNAVRRARRSVTMGPMIGIAVGAGAIDSKLDGQLTFGISLMRNGLSLLPTGEGLRQQVTSRFRAELARRLAARDGTLTDDDKRRIARDAWDAVKAELLAELKPSRFETPGLGLRVEAARLLDSGIWDIRPMLGFGVGPVQAWLGPSLRIDDGAGFVVPGELSKPIMLSDGLRSPVAEVFARGEVAITRRDEFDDVFVVGIRLTLDVI